jgi:nitrogen fixation protein NifQ
VRLLEEREELIRLLRLHRAEQDESELWISEIVAAGCMARDHLWHDLGLWSRRELSALMTRNFPTLAAKNDRDMKWKKFLYKQLCQQEGIYLCRAPACELCVDYAHCFGPES